MKKILLFLILIAILGINCSRDNDEEEINSAIIGEWNWIKSTGGFAGGTYTPESTGENRMLIISSDSIKYFTNGDLLSKIKYTIDDQKKAIDYYNENRDKQIQNNPKKFGSSIFKNRYGYVLTTSFRKIVKNSRIGVETNEEDKFQTMNNTIQVVAIVKRITLSE